MFPFRLTWRCQPCLYDRPLFPLIFSFWVEGLSAGHSRLPIARCWPFGLMTGDGNKLSIVLFGPFKHNLSDYFFKNTFLISPLVLVAGVGLGVGLGEGLVTGLGVGLGVGLAVGLIVGLGAAAKKQNTLVKRGECNRANIFTWQRHSSWCNGKRWLVITKLFSLMWERMNI